MFRIFTKALGCAAAGFVAWILTAGAFPGNAADPRWGPVEAAFMLLACFLISLVAGLFQGFQQGGKINIIVTTLIAVFLGTVAGMFGYSIGGSLATALAGPGWSLRHGLVPMTIMARTLVGVGWGLGLGVGVGASLRSVRGALSGLVGGAIGGGIAGALFDLVGTVVGATVLAVQQGDEVGSTSRMIIVVLVGAGVGLFTALFERLSRQAWVRLVLGKNEGKEWPIDAAQTTIGRDERAQIPLFVDPGLPPLAAVIVKQGSQYWLQDPGSPIGVGLNGMRVSNAALSPGDVIQVGHLQLQFLMKAGTAQRMMEARARGIAVGAPNAGAPGPAMPMPGSPAPGPQTILPNQFTQGFSAFQQTQAFPSSQPTQAVSPNQPTQAVALAPTQAVAAGQATLSGSSGLGAGASLVAITGPLAGQRTQITGPLEVGRDGAGLKLPFDAQASRRHALISAGPGGLQVQDLGSTNGTFVNGARVSQQNLRPGDVVKIGSTEFRLE